MGSLLKNSRPTTSRSWRGLRRLGGPSLVISMHLCVSESIFRGARFFFFLLRLIFGQGQLGTRSSDESRRQAVAALRGDVGVHVATSQSALRVKREHRHGYA